jgi:hypothetical protein
MQINLWEKPHKCYEEVNKQDFDSCSSSDSYLIDEATHGLKLQWDWLEIENQNNEVLKQ